MSLLVTVLPVPALALILLTFLLYYYTTRKYTYWLRKKVPYLKPSIIFGNYGSSFFLKKNIVETVNEMCLKFPNEPYFGAYYGTEPTLVIKDPELLKHVLTKDFYYFSGREASSYGDKEIFTRSLFFNHGDEWKVLRQNLSPLFSSAKMKHMFLFIEKCSKVFEQLLEKEHEKSKIIDVRSLIARFTMDCVGSCTFGVETNVMGNNPNNPFKVVGDDIFEISNIRGLKIQCRAVWPSIFYGIGLKLFPDNVSCFFKSLIEGDNKKLRNKSSYQNFVDLIFNFKEKQYVHGDSLKNPVNDKQKKVKVEASDEMLLSLCVGFFGAGYETTATSLTHTLYELAKKPECQEKIIEEIDDCLKKHDYKLGYEYITELPYSYACVAEALRLYPILGNLTREVMSDYKFPNGLRVDKGVRVHIPVYHLHRHPDYFPEPDVYRPERFLPGKLDNIKPFTYMPFGEGPRICIGMRFAKMQMYSGLVTIFKKYRVKLAADMPRELQFEPRSIITQTKGGIRLEFIPRTDVDNPRFT